MTRIERQNYRIAMILSAFLHGLLLLVAIPVGVLDGNTSLDTYSAGLIDLEAGIKEAASEIRTIPQPAKPRTVPAPKTVAAEKRPVPVPERPTQSVEKAVEKPKPLEKPKPEEKAERAEPVKPETAQPEPTAPASSSAENAGGNGTASGGTREMPAVKSLGDGSGMFSKRGLVKRPTYPKNAMNEGKEGDVVLRVLVHANGTIEEIEIRQSSGDTRLDKSALDFIRREWQFNPNDQPYYVDVMMLFRLQAPTVEYRLLGAKTRL